VRDRIPVGQCSVAPRERDRRRYGRWRGLDHRHRALFPLSLNRGRIGRRLRRMQPFPDHPEDHGPANGSDDDDADQRSGGRFRPHGFSLTRSAGRALPFLQDADQRRGAGKNVSPGGALVATGT